ncbi:hypothetical protein PACTADRAFT_48267 [Pachysolen tannophilus NRRL Y-2460]|uniref:S-adenosyl-L-methionine-dependent tRNA 4-demethylwyosine synthase n=1 Tax=Pachysolen tannophilus NRRL Y-2460 TaxID=669874 RepID=A0A1E4U3E0_PACTA|nr:hypothetical protein PACTADRAFT_48267 [Pachysolen tannophilus NRRL Y-2460]
MGVSSFVLVGALFIYLVSGGRWTLVSLVVTVYFLAKNLEKRDGASSERHDNVSSGKIIASVAAAKVAKVAKVATAATAATTTVANVPNEVDFTLSFKPKSNLLSERIKAKRVPKIINAKGKKPTKSLSPTLKSVGSNSWLNSNIIIFYTTLTGSSQRAAEKLYQKLSNDINLTNKPKLLNLDDDVNDLDDYFVNVPADLPNLVYILVLPSYDTDSPIDYFLETLQETFNDFRVDKYPLKKLAGFSVLGVGDSESWPERFCYQAKLADKWLGKLGGRRIFPLGTICMKTGGDNRIEEWINLFAESLKDDTPITLNNNRNNDDGDDIEEIGSDNDNDNDNDNDSGSGESEGTLVDVEDMGKMIRESSSDSSEVDIMERREIKEMVAKDSPTYKSLTKQGYTVVGSHSGVKICRWTKSALRGRGSCYKFAFYGIKSHLCMETTPSLSCSNKCVFCWRHGTNPVGTSWRWQVDGPEVILKGALEGHYKKIKQMRGVPGVVAERFNEAFTVKHCALSLVGEPIFYPYINEFVEMLHEKHISSFLVCNAQHPEQLNALGKVTQLYVSIDASTRDSLKKVDRPLFKDYWERLLKCLEILKTTQAHQRTVFRLTLVKGFNMTDVNEYADLVARGQPSLIEIKGATFCGSSSGNGNPLTMQNIPFYQECQQFVRNLNQELQKKGFSYDIACEHAHSCCILIAQTKFKINNKWHTHINYNKFFQLLESGDKFNDLDYVSETPDWAYWESQEGGFNPEDTKYDRKTEKAKNKLAREQQQQADLI